MADHEVLSPEKERRILDGAAALFAASGYAGASMSQIAAASGVSKGTLYNYFPAKQALFASWVQRECARRIALIFDDVAPDEAPEEALRRMGRRILDMLLSDSGLLMYRMVVAEAKQFPELAEAFFAAGPRRALARMAAWIGAQEAAGRLRAGDPDFAAEQLFALMQTRLLMRRRLGMDEAVTEADIERVVTEAVRLFLRGYGTDPLRGDGGGA
jgi:TetR/AcrR family transcriptional regulator, mexJK operon transcriptional repressor